MRYNGAMQKQHLTLTDADRATLTELLAREDLPVRTFKRATALLELDRGKTLLTVAESLEVDDSTVAAWRNKYRSDGLAFLKDAPRSGRPITISEAQRAEIIALARSTPPQGRRQWSLRMLADKAVEAGLCESISHVQVANILKNQAD
jgi:putative transposase